MGVIALNVSLYYNIDMHTGTVREYIIQVDILTQLWVLKPTVVRRHIFFPDCGHYT